MLLYYTLIIGSLNTLYLFQAKFQSAKGDYSSAKFSSKAVTALLVTAMVYEVFSVFIGVISVVIYLFILGNSTRD